MHHPLLQANQITCLRNECLLLDNLNFQLSAGELLQIVGANGSGKTSLLRILMGLLQPERGELFWKGVPIQHDREAYYRHLCYLGHQQGIKKNLTVTENLRFTFTEKTYEQNDIQQAIDEIGLSGYEEQLARQLSQGQRQKLALAKLLLSDATLWLLDEPLAALDLESAHKIQRLFAKKITEGGAIILTTHHPLTFDNLQTRLLNLTPESVSA